MSDDGLLAIVHSQSFQPKAQELARKLLHERGLTEESIQQWRDPDAELADPPWFHDVSERKLVQMLNHRRRVHRLTFYLLILALVMFILSPITSILVACGFLVLMVDVYFLVRCFSWRTPLRILFLRPFNLPQSKSLTRRFVKNNLRHFGHTYTLSDSEIAPFPEIPDIVKFLLLILGMPGYLWWHPQPSFNIHYHEDIPRLMEFMSRRVARNIVWTLSWDKLFKVTCTTETWKHAVQYLINSVELVIIDLSNAGEGLRWEIEELRFYEAIGKVVFVAHKDRASFARLFLESCRLPELNRELFVYGTNGRALMHKELSATLASVVALSTTSNNSFNRSAS